MNRQALNGFESELRSICGLEKTSIDPASLVGIGALSHLGTNLMTKLFRNTKPLRNIRRSGMATGIRSGIEGAPKGAKSRALELMVAPDITTSEDVGRLIGARLRDKTKGQKYRALKKIRKATAMAPEGVRTLPVFSDVVPGINKALESPIPKTGPIREATKLQKALPYIGAAPLVALEPAAAIHMGVNKARSLTADSPLGKTFLKRSIWRGYRESPMAEQAYSQLSSPAKKLVDFIEQGPSKPDVWKDRATELLLSPDTLSPTRIARGLSYTLSDPSKEKAMERLLGAYSHLLPKGYAGKAKKRASDYLYDLRRDYLPVPPLVPTT